MSDVVVFGVGLFVGSGVTLIFMCLISMSR